MQQETLRECPFCGGEAVMWDNKGTQADIRCGECDIGYEFQVTDYCSYDVRFKEGNSLNMDTLEYPAEVRQPVIDELVKAWNTRADDSRLAAKLERVMKLLGEAAKLLPTVSQSHEKEASELFCKIRAEREGE